MNKFKPSATKFNRRFTHNMIAIGRLTLCLLLLLPGFLQLSVSGKAAGSGASVPQGGATNVALGKRTSQSSTFATGQSSRAVDGNTNGVFANASVTHTYADAEAWWEVDLGGQYRIENVDVWNRTDCCQSRLRSFDVLVSETPFSGRQLGALRSQPGVTASNVAGQGGSPTRIAANRIGRYVRVQLAGTDYLSLAEVQVWGVPYVAQVAATNLALGKRASQSSTFASGQAARAVDGNTNGVFANASVTHTYADAEAWWEVDLGAVFEIENVDLWNRTDCCQARLSRFDVLVSNVPFAGRQLGALRNQPGVTSRNVNTQAGSPTRIAANRTGRYVRVQLAGTDYLSLAEVQVWGRPVPPSAGNGSGNYSPDRKGVTLLPKIDLRESAGQQALAPLSQAPVELKSVHQPYERPETGRQGVAIPPRDAVANERDSLAPIPTIPSPPPFYTFKGDQISLGSIPPDTMGAVGLNHVITITNEKYIIHDRTGAVLLSVPLGALLPGFNVFDPKILFDRFNNRFIVVIMFDPQAPTSGTAVLWSDPGDPFTYVGATIDVDPAATPAGGEWADYPSVGFNKNWITVQINRFGFGNQSGYKGPDIYVLDKATAYAGALSSISIFQGSFAACLALPTEAQQNVSLGCGFTIVPSVSEDNTSNDTFLAEDWFSQGGQLRMSKITGTAAAPVLTVGYQFPQSPYAWRFNSSLITGSRGYVPQRQQNAYLPSGNRPTANDSRIQNAVSRNGNFWTVHHVMLARLLTPAGTSVGGSANPDIMAAIQWWQINPNLTDSATGTPPIQRGFILDPRADNCHNGVGGLRAGCTTANQKGDHYTFPNISVNVNNDVLVGYSRFSPFTLPKGAYSFRSGADPANTMRDSMVFREGVGVYDIGTGTNIRYGDYSSTMVDPLNDTDFWTTQEYAEVADDLFFGAGVFHGIWATWWGQIKPNTSAPSSINGGSVIISEFRLRGPAGARDEFVELHNPSNSPVTIQSTDASDGWTLVYSTSAGTTTALASIPNGTVIPAHGHYLISNEVRATGINPYSLSTGTTTHPVRTATGDAMYTNDNADNGGLALFRTANQGNFIDAARADSVGFSTLAAGSIYREGSGIPACAGTPTGQVSFARKTLAPGVFQDTNNNANDFVFISTNGPAETQVCVPPATLGQPTPSNVDGNWVYLIIPPFNNPAGDINRAEFASVTERLFRVWASPQTNSRAPWLALKRT